MQDCRVRAPKKPQDESLRLETLRALDVLDTASEERFDRLTRMARRMFGVPIVLVSLVDADRQWFKSCYGLTVRETPRDISFCGHAILDDAVFVVEDAASDPHFADNPLVIGEPFIRFYAGCPLRALNGHKLGTLCLIDRQPRSLDDEDIAILKDLAAMVERELAAVQLATNDELTGIPNRRGFMTLAHYGLRFCDRENVPASLVYLDLDDFKAINDTHGHAAGDRVLAFFAERLKHTFRDSDLIARLGGDEFVVLLINSTLELAEESVARLTASLDGQARDARQPHAVRFSYGVVAFDSERHTSADDLLAAGDALMYDIKRSRR